MDRYDGFHDFVVARGGALSRTAYLLTGEHHAAEDLVQTALAKAAARWRQIVSQGQPEAYVRRIMINERITWWRRRPARPVAQVPDWAGPDEPHQIVDRITLGQALDTLTPRQRTVVVLRFYEDLSEAETADAMGCSIGTVKSQTHVALGHLRRALPLFAEQAGQYADAGAAVATAGRRRARRTAAVAALALIPFVLGLLVVYTSLGPAPVPPPVTGTPSPTVTAGPSPATPAGAPPLPTSVPAAGATLPDLPADRGVGRASLIRAHRFDDGGTTLQIAATSGWYQLRIPVDSPELLLSPDGRWLAWIDHDQQAVMRDLTGTDQQRLPGRPLAWSPTGNWLVVQAHNSARPQLVPLAEGKARQLAATNRWNNVKGVLDSGEVLRGTDARPGRTGFPLAIEDPVTGRTRRIDVELATLLKPDEHALGIGNLPVIVPLTGSTAAVQIEYQNNATVVAYIEFSLEDGAALRRIDLTGRAGVEKRTSNPCLKGRDLIWSDGRVLRQAVYGTTADGASLDMPHDGFSYLLAGCRREAAYQE
ncbi:hypothetical protein Cci01nite_18860 [Catellatospora citrea]|uniref:RNA polymerase sigma-70 factor (Sigma-E family) n=1 Tax=Catellatospora citrea TaxID=53366 RepID=A0A8J3NXY8_9ACTN|nr:SigE family RNA polymerase sigma factor [Catellatospora citrea]RKE11324.1 RNA polymerase sigma-70 factor (sigma-E family) [Catellatospora citrea]GIF96792.1 hypothetical protein Cci01nite_18860 [Catellatospora citrea]